MIDFSLKQEEILKVFASACCMIGVTGESLARIEKTHREFLKTLRDDGIGTQGAYACFIQATDFDDTEKVVLGAFIMTYLLLMDADGLLNTNFENKK